MIFAFMSDSFPDKVILDYKNSVISRESALKLLQKPNSMNCANSKLCFEKHLYRYVFSSANSS